MTPSRPSAATLPVIVALTIVYIVWGSTYLAIAYVVETMPPFLAAGTRFLAAGAMLVAFLLAQDRWRRGRGAATSRLERPRLVEWRSALIVGVLLLLGGNGMVMVAEQTIPSGIAAVIIATVPIWMSMFDALLTRRAPSRLAVGGLLVGLVGVAILLLPSDGVGALDPVGIGLLVLATISWAAGSLYARHGPLPKNQLLGTGMEQLAGGASLVILALVVGEVGRLEVGSVSRESWIALAYLIVFGSLVAFTAYVWLLNHVAVTTVATYAYVNPIVAVALGMLFRSEPLTLRTLLAAALIIGAVVAMVSGRPREAEEPGPSPEAASLEPVDKGA
ncbi:MAG TPA: EamA family transporter [Candidatus Limnocylindria bacterium]|nr:EamA family transporter [Candidatus Limnocylindria bacterium]